jgi:hypothetical protein
MSTNDEYNERMNNMCEKLRSIKIMRGDQSYTLNKERVHLCLHDAKGDEYDINLLMYVFLHECAHCVNETVGHDELFDEKFQFLLKMAVLAGEFNPKIPIDLSYCKHNEHKS